MIDERESALVMPVILNKAGSHNDAIAAVALAALEAYRTASPDAEIWGKWMNEGDGGKTVRRANDKDFAKMSAREDVLSSAEVGNAKAVAFTPVSYTEMSRDIRRLQVGSTDFERVDPIFIDEAPCIMLNYSLRMSTGKSAAQAAHALLAWWDLIAETEREEWISGGRKVNVVELFSIDFKRLALEVDPYAVIHDAGHTEIESGSATAFVMSPDPL